MRVDASSRECRANLNIAKRVSENLGKLKCLETLVTGQDCLMKKPEAD